MSYLRVEEFVFFDTKEEVKKENIFMRIIKHMIASRQASVNRMIANNSYHI